MKIQTETDDASSKKFQTRDGSLHDRFARGIAQNEAFYAFFYSRVLGARAFVQNVKVLSFKPIRGELITHKMKARVADGFYRLEYLDKRSPNKIRARPILVEHKFHKDPSTWIQVGEYVFVYLRDVARAIKSDPRLKKDYCVDDKIVAPTVIVFYCGYEPWNFDKEKIELEIPPELEEFKAELRCEFVSIRELNADDFSDSPVVQTLILLWQAVADPNLRKEDVERVFAPVFNGDEFEQWEDVLSFCIIYWVEGLEARGIHMTTDEVFSLVDRIKDGNLRKEVKMFADIWAADEMDKIKTNLEQARGDLEQARGDLKQALIREQDAEKRAAQYQSELKESQRVLEEERRVLEEERRQATMRQDNVFWTVISARFPSLPITISSRISQVADYSRCLLDDVLAASSIEDFNARLDARLAAS